MMVWKMLHPRMTYEMLGLLPEFLTEHDPRPAREQFDKNYRHGTAADGDRCRDFACCRGSVAC